MHIHTYKYNNIQLNIVVKHKLKLKKSNKTIIFFHFVKNKIISSHIKTKNYYYLEI